MTHPLGSGRVKDPLSGKIRIICIQDSKMCMYTVHFANLTIKRYELLASMDISSVQTVTLI
jgi:hypothetical protein